MHKYNAHGATDVTGYGLLGHAQNLAKNQKSEVSFVIHNLPVIAKMTAVAKACGNMFQLLQGLSAETSGNDDKVVFSSQQFDTNILLIIFRRTFDLFTSRTSRCVLQRH